MSPAAPVHADISESSLTGRRGQPGLQRGACLHFSTNTEQKMKHPAAGGNQLARDVTPDCSRTVGPAQSRVLAVSIYNHEGRDWLPR